MADTNKVRFGIKNCYYAVLTENENGVVSYGTVKPLKGARSFSFSKEGGDSSNWYADDGVYYRLAGTDGGYSGDLTLAKVPDDFLIDVLGFFKDRNNVLVEDAEATPKEFALMMEFSGDKMKTRHCFYRCSASRPDIQANTIEEQAEPQEETIPIVAIPVSFTTGTGQNVATRTIVKAKANATDSATQYNAWFTQVQIPSLPTTA